MGGHAIKRPSFEEEGCRQSPLSIFAPWLRQKLNRIVNLYAAINKDIIDFLTQFAILSHTSLKIKIALGSLLNQMFRMKEMILFCIIDFQKTKKERSIYLNKLKRTAKEGSAITLMSQK